MRSRGRVSDSSTLGLAAAKGGLLVAEGLAEGLDVEVALLEGVAVLEGVRVPLGDAVADGVWLGVVVGLAVASGPGS